MCVSVCVCASIRLNVGEWFKVHVFDQVFVNWTRRVCYVQMFSSIECNVTFLVLLETVAENKYSVKVDGKRTINNMSQTVVIRRLARLEFINITFQENPTNQKTLCSFTVQQLWQWIPSDTSPPNKMQIVGRWPNHMSIFLLFYDVHSCPKKPAYCKISTLNFTLYFYTHLTWTQSRRPVDLRMLYGSTISSDTRFSRFDQPVWRSFVGSKLNQLVYI